MFTNDLTDAQVLAIVGHYEGIERQGRSHQLSNAEKAEFDGAWDEMLARELRV